MRDYRKERSDNADLNRLRAEEQDRNNESKINAHANIVANRRDAEYLDSMRKRDASNRMLSDTYNAGGQDMARGLGLGQPIQQAQQQMQAQQQALPSPDEVAQGALAKMEKFGPEIIPEIKQSLEQMRQDPQYGDGYVDAVKNIMDQEMQGLRNSMQGQQISTINEITPEESVASNASKAIMGQTAAIGQEQREA